MTTVQLESQSATKSEIRMPPYMKYGLRLNRPTRRTYVGFWDSSETAEDFVKHSKAVRAENVANRGLNEISKRIREEIDTRLWAVMYLKYSMGRIDATERVRIQLSDLANLAKLSLSDGELSPSLAVEHLEQPFEHLPVELHMQILDRRLRDACVGTEAVWAVLRQLQCRLTLEISGHPQDRDVAFRVFDNCSQARYFSTGDIRCGNWQEFMVDVPSERVGASKHIEGAHISTDYISVSTSPYRVWNFIRNRKSANQKIAVIDLRVLDRLGIAYSSTTEDLGFNNKPKYATEHHILVEGWIPDRSILGFLSKESFFELLEEAQVDTSGETSPIPLTEYERKIPFERIRRRLI